jgi:hypothetical protein
MASLIRVGYGDYRRLLPPNHHYRTDGSFGPSEQRLAPTRRTGEAVLNYGKKAALTGEPVRGVRGISELHGAPGAGSNGKHDVVAFGPKDVVHVFKGCGSHILKMQKGSRKPKARRKPELGKRDREKKGAARATAEKLLANRIKKWEEDGDEREDILKAMSNLILTKPIQTMADTRYSSIVGPPGLMRSGK